MPRRWLVKTEPDSYSYADLARDRKTTWDGVRNPAAQAHLRSMQAGDSVLVYHTGKEKSVVGIARVARAPYPEPGAAPESRTVAVDLEPVRALGRPVTLSALKGDPGCAGFDLVRLPRLSVMPVPDRAWDVIESRAAATKEA
jgi:predicted RNA-binding protein with PUA-like domain